MNYVEVEEGSLRDFLRNALRNEAVQSTINRLDSIISDLQETLAIVPLIYMKLLYTAIRNAGTNPEQVDVIKGTGPYGQFLAVTAGGVRIGEVRFIVSYADGFMMNALLHLSPEAVVLINNRTAIAQIRR